MIESKNTNNIALKAQELKDCLQSACKKMAPLWSLENFVAVNPYLGLSNMKFDEAMSMLSQRGNIKATLPIDFYLKAIADGKIKKADVKEALLKKQHHQAETPEEFLESIEELNDNNWSSSNLNNILEVAQKITGQNWKRFMVERVSEWGATYFDHHQASWNTASDKGIFSAWKNEASIDKSPEIMGLTNFRKLVNELPEDAFSAIQYAIEELSIPKNVLEAYLHKLLLNVGGWSAYVARIDWDKNLAGEEGTELIEFLAILISWEVLIFQSLECNNMTRERNIIMRQYLHQNHAYNKELDKQLLLQDAFDIANQRQLIEKFNAASIATEIPQIPDVQAIFCIDVRSEVFRRHLEDTSTKISTLGFAGFFAFPIKYVPIAHEEGMNQCPVLLNTSHTVHEVLPSEKQMANSIKKRQLKHHLAHAWKSFKVGTISCFSFVGPIGFSFLPKLFTDSFGLTRPVPNPTQEGIHKSLLDQKDISLKPSNSKSGIPLAERVQMGESALKAMSLTYNFARLVLIVGHGSSTVNNPHATGLDCGACGGHTGEANAKVAVKVLNDLEVREALRSKGIDIPDTTYFIACQHDTTTDIVTIFNENNIPDSHEEDLIILKSKLTVAGKTARVERAMRMNIKNTANIDKAIFDRSVDWSQVRPEWGLAGCSSFVVAPRSRTKKVNLGGKSFLHSYDWVKDDEFKTLELIMTAPMVVTSWINLQYYASTVDNKTYGSGNKALHNVVAGLGVLEGHSGDLRTGLPWQSVHDGEKFQHEPLRLNVIIEAPLEAMENILIKHKSIKELVENEWIYLFAMNNEGKIAHKYTPEYKWVEVA